MACYCDGERADVYQEYERTARKTHRCEDCGRAIEAGEQHEEIRTLYDGQWSRTRICAYCIAVREALQDRLPCYCYWIGGLYDDEFLRDHIDALKEAGTGDGFTVLRLIAAGRRAKRAKAEIAKVAASAAGESERCDPAVFRARGRS